MQTYLALFYAKGKDWPLAAPLLERVLAQSPDRLPALEALAIVRERQGRIEEAIRLRQKIKAVEPVDGGGVRITSENTVEVEGAARPALVAETISMQFE